MKTLKPGKSEDPLRLNRALVDTTPPYAAKPPPTPMPSDGTPRSSI